MFKLEGRTMTAGALDKDVIRFVYGEGDDERNDRVVEQMDSNRPSLAFCDRPGCIWFLSMIASENEELLHTTARLFLHLSAQVDRKRMARHQETEALRERQEREISAMLRMADISDHVVARSNTATSTSHASRMDSQSVPWPTPGLDATGPAVVLATPKIVDGKLTESMVLRHEKELRELADRHRHEGTEALLEANCNFSSFLCAAGPENFKHAMAKYVDVLHQRGSGGSRSGGSSSLSHMSVSEIADALVDVLVVKVINPLRGVVVGARPKDPALASIVLELSPLRQLGACNALCRQSAGGEVSSGDAQERLCLRVQDHLLRLATGHHSLLVLLGSSREIVDAVLSPPSDPLSTSPTFSYSLPNYEGASSASISSGVGCSRAPELLLPLSVEHRDGLCGSSAAGALVFSPLAGSHLQVAVTTTLYAGNIVARCDTETRQPEKESWESWTRGVIRDTVHLAVATGCTRYTVAVLPSVGRLVVPPLSSAAASASVSGDALVLDCLHRVVADVQMASCMSKPPHNHGLHLSGLLHGLSEWHGVLPPIHTEVGQVPFNLPMSVRVFLDAEPLELPAAEAFGRDVEVVARTAAAAA